MKFRRGLTIEKHSKTLAVVLISDYEEIEFYEFYRQIQKKTDRIFKNHSIVN